MHNKVPTRWVSTLQQHSNYYLPTKKLIGRGRKKKGFPLCFWRAEEPILITGKAFLSTSSAHSVSCTGLFYIFCLPFGFWPFLRWFFRECGVALLTIICSRMNCHPFYLQEGKKSPFIRMILILFSNYKREQIEEAFAPLEERFEWNGKTDSGKSSLCFKRGRGLEPPFGAGFCNFHVFPCSLSSFGESFSDSFCLPKGPKLPLLPELSPLVHWLHSGPFFHWPVDIFGQFEKKEGERKKLWWTR